MMVAVLVPTVAADATADAPETVGITVDATVAAEADAIAGEMVIVVAVDIEGAFAETIAAILGRDTAAVSAV
jgi:hypothetical protein